MIKQPQKKRCLLSSAAPNNAHTHTADIPEKFWLSTYYKVINEGHLSTCSSAMDDVSIVPAASQIFLRIRSPESPQQHLPKRSGVQPKGHRRDLGLRTRAARPASKERGADADDREAHSTRENTGESRT